MAPRAARLTLAAVAALFAAAVAAPAQAAALHADFNPRSITGPTIRQGADGADHTLMCPPEENVLGGGFTVSAPAGRTLDAKSSDLISSRPDADATGWIVAVRKSVKPTDGHARVAADLTVQIVCTEGEVSPGA
ncbi:hypothetical protein [Actinospica robiniae]|uniref:hypothetical protein n=1 Tax=Actinospica robiniae TaxID=304901 RepID=UPI00040698BB|nr:hypothetical protein [Actinospica robiniae]